MAKVNFVNYKFCYNSRLDQISSRASWVQGQGWDWRETRTLRSPQCPLPHSRFADDTLFCIKTHLQSIRTPRPRRKRAAGTHYRVSRWLTTTQGEFSPQPTSYLSFTFLSGPFKDIFNYLKMFINLNYRYHAIEGELSIHYYDYFEFE